MHTTIDNTVSTPEAIVSMALRNSASGEGRPTPHATIRYDKLVDYVDLPVLATLPIDLMTTQGTVRHKALVTNAAII